MAILHFNPLAAVCAAYARAAVSVVFLVLLPLGLVALLCSCWRHPCSNCATCSLRAFISTGSVSCFSFEMKPGGGFGGVTLFASRSSLDGVFPLYPLSRGRSPLEVFLVEGDIVSVTVWSQIVFPQTTPMMFKSLLGSCRMVLAEREQCVG